jgi:hypothetical protein
MTSRSGDRVADARSVVIAYMPDYQVDAVVHLGEGLDSLASSRPRRHPRTSTHRY